MYTPQQAGGRKVGNPLRNEGIEPRARLSTFLTHTSGLQRVQVMTLEELIEEARERVSRDPAEREAERRQQQEQRRQELTADAVSRIDVSLPDPLRPYVTYAGHDRDDGRPQEWFPVFFKIQAPRLAQMSFNAALNPEPNPDRTLRVDSIRVGDKKFSNWDEAIIEAARPRIGEELPADTKPPTRR